jgi:hypothetical protein
VRIKIGAKIVSHGRYVTFQLTEVAVSRQMFADRERRPRRHDGRLGSDATGDDSEGAP